MKYEIYKNSDDKYVSPKNGKQYDSKKAFIAHLSFVSERHVPIAQKRRNSEKVACRFCAKEMSEWCIGKHEKICYLNPDNLKLCLMCGSPIVDYKNTKGTCSHRCSNTFFKKGRDIAEHNYRSTCFQHHKKECIICGEHRIVAVHHYDGDNKNNDLKNLVPLCPTHHQYYHSNYRYLICEEVEEYIKKFSEWYDVLILKGVYNCNISDRLFQFYKNKI